MTWKFLVNASHDPAKLSMLSGNGLSKTTSGASIGPASANRICLPAIVLVSVGIFTLGVSKESAAFLAALIFGHSGDTSINDEALS